MTRITIDVNDEWLKAARDVLGTATKVATVNEALRSFAVRKQAREAIAALDSAEMDYSGSAESWRFGGGRDLARVVEDAQDRAAHDGRRHLPGGHHRIRAAGSIPAGGLPPPN